MTEGETGIDEVELVEPRRAEGKDGEGERECGEWERVIEFWEGKEEEWESGLLGGRFREGGVDLFRELFNGTGSEVGWRVGDVERREGEWEERGLLAGVGVDAEETRGEEEEEGMAGTEAEEGRREEEIGR